MRSRPPFIERALHSPRVAAWAERDLGWVRRLHRGVQSRALARVLVVASWLGDGIFWYALIAAVALAGGTDGRDIATQMVLAGLVNLTVYRWLKRTMSRPRPFSQCSDIRACARTLDEFSFPSGHVLHAVTFTIILLNYYPHAGFALLPAIVLIALSRVVLGLHYLSDVAAGAAIGVVVASLILALY
ncbi:MAG: phosphatase PAP2 family protein [Burkholderiaceae bacterium]